MNWSIKARLALFISAIVLLTFLTGWAAQTTWRRMTHLGKQFTEAQLASFSTAEQFQAYLLELDNLPLRYQIRHDPLDRNAFLTNYNALNEWIDKQKVNVQRLAIGSEMSNLLVQIDVTFDTYGNVGTNLLLKIEASPQASSIDDLGRFEKVSYQLRTLGYRLINAQDQAMIQFLGSSRSSFIYFRNLIFTALVILLVLMAWLAVVVYNELIAPLRVKLVQSEELIERNEKLASLGMLAAGVAHEIRNPLTAIKAWLFMHQKHLQPGTPEFADAELIGREINRLERIVKDFLQFARPSEPQRETMAADQPLKEVQEFMRPHLEKANIQLQLEAVSPAPVVRMDPAQIKQVLINLIQNAADAIGQNGMITLRVVERRKHLNGRLAEVVILEVSDTGNGIPPEVEKRLFDPFFSTKEGGTGLGLSIASRILEKHGGALQYQTQVNRGTTFGIILPRA